MRQPTVNQKSKTENRHSTMNYKYVIIGSGPTGLGAAYRLKELGITDFIVLEKEDRIGGLSKSFVDEKGFTWDVGGHVQFSHYKYFDDLMLKALGEDGWLSHQRESWVWIENRFVPYPFQNNIKYLSPDTMWKCLQGIINNYKFPNNQKPANFREWILATFGQGLADTFMFPYNFKVWAFPPEEMNAVWVGERVAITDLQRVTKNIIFNQDDFSWGPNSTFKFPKRGGHRRHLGICGQPHRARVRKTERYGRTSNSGRRKKSFWADGEEIHLRVPDEHRTDSICSLRK